MKAAISVATILITGLSSIASARDIAVKYSETDVRNQGVTPIRVDTAICDSERNPTDCDLLAFGARGKVLRFRVRAKTQSYTYVSASQREITKTNVGPGDIDLLLRLGVALEKFGQDCVSAVYVDNETSEILSIQPSCDI